MLLSVVLIRYFGHCNYTFTNIQKHSDICLCNIWSSRTQITDVIICK